MFVVESSIFVVCIVLCAASAAYAGAQGSPADRVLLRDVGAQTFHRGRLTAARRVPPVPQLQCVGGSYGCSGADSDALFPSALCRNEGGDGVNVAWQCEVVGLPDNVKLGRLEVSCEGYNNPDDPYVLRDSCALEYELDRTEAGRQQQQQPQPQPQTHTKEVYVRPVSNTSSEVAIAIIFFVIVVVFLLLPFFLCVVDSTNSHVVHHRRREHVHYVDAGPPPAAAAFAASSASWDAADAAYSARAARRAADDAHYYSSRTHYSAPPPSYHSAPSSSSSWGGGWSSGGGSSSSSSSKSSSGGGDKSSKVSTGFASTKRR